MIINCDHCRTAFNIDPTMIKEGGSKLRCASCKEVFTVFPEPQAAAPQIADAPQRKEPAFSSDAAFDEDTMTMVGFSEDVFEHTTERRSRYVELGRIGEGGMGEIKVAKDTQLLRKVAVKALKKEAAASPAALSYFIREGQITAQLDHPNIVPLYTVKESNDTGQGVSFVMKLIKGQTLAEIITKARNHYKENPKQRLPYELSLTSRLGYFLKVCEGMAYAHRKEVIHRDIKPANIMVGDFGEVYIMDWGIAKMVKEMPETLFGIQKVAAQKEGRYIGGTQVGSVVGTPGYISPEQVRGLPTVGHSSDLFSMGVMLFELVTLKPARTGDMAKRLEMAEKAQIEPITHYSPEKKIPRELKCIIEKATAADSAGRYPAITDLAEDVRRFMAGEEVSVLPDNLPRKMWRWMNQHRHLTVIVILSFLLVSSAVTIGSLFQQQDALKKARMREKKLTSLLSKVSAQAHYIDNRFIRLEGLLAGLANSAMFLVQHGAKSDERLYWLADFNTPGKAPPDLVSSQLYRKDVSIDYPVVKLAPGVVRDDVMEIMRKLAPLRHFFKKMFLDSRSSFSPLNEIETRRLMTIHGLPISWAYIGLELGVMYSYPGKGTYSPEYDPRVRPWYALGARKNAVYWGNPYIDAQGLGMVLPCATSLYDQEGRFFGVVGMDVTYNNIIQDSLTRSGAIGVIESFLLDEQARIVVKSSQLGIALEEIPKDAALSLELFPVREVADRIRRKESGLIEVQRGGESRLILFHEIPSLDWYYVEEIRSIAVLGRQD